MHTLAVLRKRLKCCVVEGNSSETWRGREQQLTSDPVVVVFFKSLSLIPRAVLATHSEGTAPSDTWADIIAKIGATESCLSGFPRCD